MESQALWWGILFAPRKARALFSLGRKSRNYFHTELELGLEEKEVGELRSRMLPAERNA
jgi:hypothetical protein